MMWIIFARTPRPDAQYWAGRRWLAALDAAGWPAVLAYVVLSVQQPMGVLKPMAVAVVLLAAMQRLSTALLRNHRYRFTTWRWARLLAALLVVGWCLKLMVS